MSDPIEQDLVVTAVLAVSRHQPAPSGLRSVEREGKRKEVGALNGDEARQILRRWLGDH